MAEFSLYDTDVGFDLKEWYHQQEVEYCVFKKKPFLDSLKRNPNAGGEVDPVPVLYSGGQGMGATSYSSALANAGAPKGAKFMVTYGTYNTFVQFDEKARRGATGKQHAFADIVKMTTDSTLDHTGLDLSVQAWGNGGAPLGQCGSIDTGTNIVTLANKDDIVNFWEGMKIVHSTTDGSTATDTLADAGAALTITSVNRAAGQFTYTGTDPTTLADDYLFRQYSFAGDVSQGVLMKGIDAWNPYTVPVSTDSFFSVNRYQKDMLYGYTSNGDTTIESGNNIDRIRKLASTANSRMGSTPEDCWVHTRQWEQLSITLQQQGIRPIEVGNSTGTAGYNALQIACAYGTLKIKADRHCPVTRVRLINPEYIELRSIGPVMSALDEDGLKLRKINGTNGPAWQLDWVTYGQIIVTKPSEMAVGALQAIS
jgi:hypothetical protein